jgi:hypothetical protein
MSDTVTGEVGVYTTGDLTRDAITVKHTEVPVNWYRVNRPTIFAGFQQEWLTGEGDADSRDEGVRFRLTAGAGTGSRYMVLLVNLPDGTRVEEYVDIAEVVGDRIRAIVDEHTGEVTP